MVYTWHQNNSGYTLTSVLLIYNYNSYTIKVSAPNYGLTNGTDSDSAAWKSYFGGQSTSVTIPAGGYQSLYTRSIQNGKNWGIISRLNITNNSTGASAGATVFDLAYYDSSKSGNAQSFAPVDGSPCQRGKGNDFFANVTCTLPITSSHGTNGQRVNFGSIRGSSFSGNECVTLVDASGQVGGKLEGAYGEQMNITVTVQNQTGSSRSFRIYLGSSSGDHTPVCSLNGSTVSYNNIATQRTYYDVIDLGVISNGSSTAVNFFSVLPGGTSTPYSFGARPL
jgi:hypothetical protein